MKTDRKKVFWRGRLIRTYLCKKRG